MKGFKLDTLIYHGEKKSLKRNIKN